ncbi:MAG: ATP-binding cassette domain-containing protein, partial [Bacteroidota bacterium]
MGGRNLLDNLALTIHRGEQWAVVGPSGSGKTVLAHTLTGRHFYTGRIGYYFAGEGASGPGETTGQTQEETGGASTQAMEREATGSPVAGDMEGGAGIPGRRNRIVLVDQQHRFKNRPGATDLYYQQRYNASDADQTITVEQ